MSMMKPHAAKNIFHAYTEPQLFFTPEALFKIQCYVEECEKEIGWLGRIRKDGEVYVCDEVFLLHQEVGAAATDITSDGLVQLLDEIGVEENDTLRLWGHSHVKMGVNPSAEDMKTPQLFLKNGCDFFFRIICNQKGDMGVTFFDWQNNYYIEDMAWGIGYAADQGVRTAIKAEMDEKVKLFKTTYERGGHWDPIRREWVYDDDKKKEGSQTTALTTTNGDGGTSSAGDFKVENFIGAYADTPVLLVRMLCQPGAEGKAYHLSFLDIFKTMQKYQLSYRELVTVIRHFAGKEDEEGAAYMEKAKALYLAIPAGIRGLIKAGFFQGDNPDVIAAMEKYNVLTFNDVFDMIWDADEEVEDGIVYLD